MQGTHTGGPCRVYSMAQSKSLYSEVKINGNFTQKTCLSELGTEETENHEFENKITKVMIQALNSFHYQRLHMQIS